MSVLPQLVQSYLGTSLTETNWRISHNLCHSCQSTSNEATSLCVPKEQVSIIILNKFYVSTRAHHHCAQHGARNGTHLGLIPTSVTSTLLVNGKECPDDMCTFAQDTITRNINCVTRTSRDGEEQRRAEWVLGLYINLLTLEYDPGWGPLSLSDGSNLFFL